MSRDFSDYMDEYCEELFGHTHWAYLDTCSKEQLEKYPHRAENGIAFFEEDTRDEEGDWE